MSGIVLGPRDTEWTLQVPALMKLTSDILVCPAVMVIWREMGQRREMMGTGAAGWSAKASLMKNHFIRDLMSVGK